MKIIIEDPSDWDFMDMFWGQGKDIIKEIYDADKLDTFISLIEDTYPDGIDMTELNDWVAYDSDNLFPMLGMLSGLEDYIDSKLIDKALTEAEEVLDNMEDEFERENVEQLVDALSSFDSELDSIMSVGESEELSIMISAIQSNTAYLDDTGNDLDRMIDDIVSYLDNAGVNY